MLLLIFSLIFCTTTSTDIVNNISASVFASTSTTIKITRTHLNPNEDEIYKEYIYKENDKIRIDVDFGDSTITTFVYDGKTGYKDGKALSKAGSIEMVLFGCPCGYLSAMEQIYESDYEETAAIFATGRQGNKLFLDYKTHLPIRYELNNKSVVFGKYKKIDGFGNFPFFMAKTGPDGVAAITRITDVEKMIILPANFFSVPRHSDTETLD